MAQSPQFDTDAWRKERDEKLTAWFGNQDAVDFVTIYGDMTEYLDDVMDGEEVTSERTTRMTFHALIDFPTNRFFLQWGNILVPQISMFVCAWLDSVAMEKERDPLMLDHAHSMRFIYTRIVHSVVEILHGREEMLRLAPEINRFFLTETRSQYLSNLNSP